VLDIVLAMPVGKRIPTICQTYWLVRDQANGQTGPLSVDDGWLNRFMCCGSDWHLWLVSMGLVGSGWFFDADPLDNSLALNKKCRVLFSDNNK